MYVNDPHAERISLVVETKKDKQVCKRALGAAGVRFSMVQRVDLLPLPGVINEPISGAVAKGLGVTALGEYGERGFSGLRRLEADQIVSEIYGEPGDYPGDLMLSNR